MSTPDVAGPADFGTDPAAVAQRWISEIGLAEKDTADWYRRGKLINARYVDERKNISETRRRFAILWSNVQTLGPALYARTPTAVVSRRFKDPDPVGRMASEVLERAVNFSLEDYDFDRVMMLCRQDYLLPGRGQVWITYVPHMKQARLPLIDGKDVTGREYEPDDIDEDEEGQYVTEDQVEYEEARCGHIAWQDFFTNPAREWSEVRWVAKRSYMTRQALVKRFGAIGKLVPLDWSPNGYNTNSNDADKDEQFKKAVIYEVWDADSRKAYWVSKGWTSRCLDIRPDPLKLKDFFPCPPALLTTTAPDSIIPAPDYTLYQDQAEEVDELTGRMGLLIDALRLNGFYAADEKGLIQQVLQKGNENKLIPVDSWAAFAERGGTKGLIEWLPLDMVAKALQACIETRKQVLDDIYQITGISDIMRGDTEAQETAAAQRMKGNWGSLRIRDRKAEIARFARDIIRIKAEIIAEHFSEDTLKKMTGVQMYSTIAERDMAGQQYQMMAQQAQAQQQPPPPEPPMLGSPTWEEVMALLKDNALRSFRIDIESDSTVEPDATEQQEQAVQFVTTIGTVLAQSAEVVAMAPPLGKLVGESVKFLTRRFAVGRDMEETIDQVMDAIGQMPPPAAGAPAGDPNAVKVGELELQTEQLKQQGAMQVKQMEAAMQQQQMPLDQAALQLKFAALQRDPEPQANA